MILRRWVAPLIGLGLLLGMGQSIAVQLVVVESRGSSLRPGTRLDGGTPVQLKEGEKVALITPDGRVITLRGAYDGPADQGKGEAGGGAQNASMALAALVATRRDRASTVGAVRSGAGAAALPEPWLIDITRPGDRCLREGETPVWWRPTTAGNEPFTVYPIDRTWKADFSWQEGASTMLAPALGKLEATKSFSVKTAGQEYAIRLNIIPRDLVDPTILTAWMLQKSCFQQADAFLRVLEQAQPPSNPGATTKAPEAREHAS